MVFLCFNYGTRRDQWSSFKGSCRDEEISFAALRGAEYVVEVGCTQGSTNSEVVN